MKKLLSPLLMVAVLVYSCAAALATPTVVFEKTVVNLGQMVAGTKRTATFVFKNNGDSPLDITKISSMCDCTALPRTSISHVLPGKSGKVVAVFDSTGSEGNVVKRILVKTNDPAHEKYTLTVTAKVTPIAKLKPESVGFGWLKPGAKYETVVTLRPMTTKRFRILKVAPTRHASVSRIRASATEKGAYELTVVVKAGAEESRVLEKLRVITSLPGHPAVPIQVFGNVAKEIPKDVQPP